MFEERIRLEQRDEAERLGWRRELPFLSSEHAKGKHAVRNDELQDRLKTEDQKKIKEHADRRAETRSSPGGTN